MKLIKYLIIFFTLLIIGIYFYIQIDLNSYFKVKNIITLTDIDKDWINDIDDILKWAREEVNNKTTYKSAYYSWGYPPQNEWVCTDVVWRALLNAWINLKDLVDSDIKNNITFYSRVEWKADKNIDFRRVPNLDVYLSRKAIKLTNEVLPLNLENLIEWQPWDIVIFWKPKDHIAIVSDKRNKQWVPYIIHNSAPIPKENDWLIYWDQNISPIIGHYRWKY